MLPEQRVLVVIPARDGSKRLPRKNVLPLAGKPLIEWTLEAALASGVADRIVVTSDDQEVLAIAARYEGIDVLNRSKELATDVTPTIDVVLDVLEKEKREGRLFETVMLLQPTSPLRSAQDIRSACALFAMKDGCSVISVCEVDHPLQWCGTVDADGIMHGFVMIDGEGAQTLPPSYRLNGAIYIASIDSVNARKSLYSKPSIAYRMRRENSIDIDTQLDLAVCAAILDSQRVTLGQI